MYMHGILLYRTVISVLVVTAVVLYFVLTAVHVTAQVRFITLHRCTA